MGMSEAQGQVGKAMKDLTTLWQQTKAEWNDAQSAGFEKQYLEPLEKNVRDAVGAMEHMTSLLSTIKRECSDG